MGIGTPSGGTPFGPIGRNNEVSKNALNNALNRQFWTNSGNVSPGGNSVFIPPTNAQGMADLTDSEIEEVKAYSVIYSTPNAGGGWIWSSQRKSKSQAYYTLAGESIEVAGVTGTDAFGNAITLDDGSAEITDLGEKRMVVTQPMVPGQKYVLRSQEDLDNGTPCIWDGEKLVPTSDVATAEFIISRYEFNESTTDYTSVLFGTRPREKMAFVAEEHGAEFTEEEIRRKWAMFDGANIDGVMYQLEWLTVDDIDDEAYGIKTPIESDDEDEGADSNYNLYADGDTGSDTDSDTDSDTSQKRDRSHRVLVHPITGQAWEASTGCIGRVVPWLGNSFADNVFDINQEALPGFSDLYQNAEDVWRNGISKPANWLAPDGTAYCEAIYKLPDEPDATGQAKVILPIKAGLMHVDIPPRPSAVDLRDELGSDSVSAALPTVYGYVKEYDVTDSDEYKKITCAGYVARTMGLIEPLSDSTPSPQSAHYCADDTVFVTTYVITSGDDAEEEPEEVPTKYKSYFDAAATYTLIQADYVKGKKYAVWKCVVSYKPATTGTVMYLDPETKYVPLYQGGMHVKTTGVNPIIKTVSGEQNLCGTYTYEYDDAEMETVKLKPRYLPEPCVLASVSGTSLVYTIGEYGEEFLVPFQSLICDNPILGYTYFENLGADYGVNSYASITCDKENGEWVCTVKFKPKKIEEGPNIPFWYGLTSTHRMQVTTSKAAAHKQWIPALSTGLDRNETLTPGMVVDYEMATSDLHYKVHSKYGDASYEEPATQIGTALENSFVDKQTTFTYASVTAPTPYQTEMEGTPKTTVASIKFDLPTREELEKYTLIEPDDYWVKSVDYLDIEDVPTIREPNTILYTTPVLTNNATPVIREPYGAFNDCENLEGLALWGRYDKLNTFYAMTCRLDYVPYGYALPTKTPSCFFKATTEENCAPHLTGVSFTIERIDSKLIVKGGCYVPCSSLSIQNNM